MYIFQLAYFIIHRKEPDYGHDNTRSIEIDD